VITLKVEWTDEN